LISFESICKVFPNGCTAVDRLSLEVQAGETLVLLGTSGSGKTTTMKMVNRLIEPTQGRIFIQGNCVQEQDPITLRRSMGYAIQHIGLLPHLTVADNIAVVPKLEKWARPRIEARVDTLLDMVGLDPADFRTRYPHQLSGGQQQRIGVARALAADPPIILMDEPFGALDPITREQLQNEFLELESEIAKTVLFVTHDIFEAVKMGDRIALLDQGCLQQVATPQELVAHPANAFVDQFLGQHRFQLTLLTQSIRPIVKVHTGEKTTPVFTSCPVHLTARQSLIEALDSFKQAGLSSLPVFDKKHYIGELKKETLLQNLTDIINETV